MPVIKNKTKGNFVNVYKGIVMDQRLGLKERGLMATLLSFPEEWEFTLAGLVKILPDGEKSVRSAFNRLIRLGYITKNQSRRKDGRYGTQVIEVNETPLISVVTEGTLPVLQEDRAERLLDAPLGSFPLTVYPAMEKRQQPKGISDKVSQLNNNILSNKELNNNQSIYPEEIDKLRNRIKEQVEYELIVYDEPTIKEELEELVEIMVEVMISSAESYVLENETVPGCLVRERFSMLDASSMRYAMDCLGRNKTGVRNIKKYLMTTLYNAPVTVGNYYKQLVQHDMS